MHDVRGVLLDSEGTESAEVVGQQDNQIFTLIVLMVTMLIYNSKGGREMTSINWSILIKSTIFHTSIQP